MAKFLALAWRSPVLDIGLANMPMAIDMAIPFIMERPASLVRTSGLSTTFSGKRPLLHNFPSAKREKSSTFSRES
jgi:hypothetical protein